MRAGDAGLVVRVRKAVQGDAEGIAALWNAHIRTGTVTFTSDEKSLEDIQRMIASRSAFVVAERDGEFAGFATYGRFRPGPGYAGTAEVTVFVADKAQGQGTGRALAEALEHSARADGLHVLVAGISGENPAAQAFFGSLGYVRTGLMPEVGRKFGRWLDLVLMQKRI